MDASFWIIKIAFYHNQQFLELTGVIRKDDIDALVAAALAHVALVLCSTTTDFNRSFAR